MCHVCVHTHTHLIPHLCNGILFDNNRKGDPVICNCMGELGGNSTKWHKPDTERQILPAAAAAKSLQSCPTLRDPRDGSPLGSPVPGILQARTLEWVAISFSSAWKWKVKMKSPSRVRLLATPWTAAYQAPPSMGFSRQEYWSGVPLPSPKYFLVSLIKHCTCRNRVE